MYIGPRPSLHESASVPPAIPNKRDCQPYGRFTISRIDGLTDQLIDRPKGDWLKRAKRDVPVPFGAGVQCPCPGRGGRVCSSIPKPAFDKDISA